MYVLGCKILTVVQNWFGGSRCFFCRVKHRGVFNDVDKRPEIKGAEFFQTTFSSHTQNYTPHTQRLKIKINTWNTITLRYHTHSHSSNSKQKQC